jgi:pimeloyl-ACP methyl ester carboxylesterase
VQGETDRARDAIRAIHPGAPFVAIPDAGHWVAYEAPNAFAAALRGMLTATEQRHNEHA